MDWTQCFFVVFGNLAVILPLWLWTRSESRSDVRHLDAKLDSNRELVIAIHNETREFHFSIREEMKDFHYRLLEIERSRK